MYRLDIRLLRQPWAWASVQKFHWNYLRLQRTSICMTEHEQVKIAFREAKNMEEASSIDVVFYMYVDENEECESLELLATHELYIF